MSNTTKCKSGGFKLLDLWVILETDIFILMFPSNAVAIKLKYLLLQCFISLSSNCLYVYYVCITCFHWTEFLMTCLGTSLHIYVFQSSSVIIAFAWPSKTFYVSQIINWKFYKCYVIVRVHIFFGMIELLKEGIFFITVIISTILSLYSLFRCRIWNLFCYGELRWFLAPFCALIF